MTAGGLVSNDRRITFSKAQPARILRPKARFARFIRTDNKLKPIKLVQIDAFDYSGKKLLPSQISVQTRHTVSLTNPSCELSSEVAVKANSNHILIDFGNEVEIAGLSIANSPGADGANAIGCSLQILTQSGRAVFGVPIRDNRTVYNIRTSPPDPAFKREQMGRNREIIPVPQPCCLCIPTTVRKPRYVVIQRDEQLAIKAAIATPANQLPIAEPVDFAKAPAVGNVAYNDPARYGGYSPYKQRGKMRLLRLRVCLIGDIVGANGDGVATDNGGGGGTYLKCFIA